MPNLQNAINIALDFIKKWEGLASKSQNKISYFSDTNIDDSVPIYSYADSGGVYTIGWGTINFNVIDSRPVQSGDTITISQANAELNYEVTNDANELINYSNASNFNDNQFAALISLAYNAGISSAKKMIDYINEGHTQSEIDAFWQNFHIKDRNGNVVQGLINRRKDETMLFDGNYNELYSYYLRNQSNINLLLYASIVCFAAGLLIYKINKKAE